MKSALEYINSTPKLLSLLYDLNLLPEQMEDKRPLCLIAVLHEEHEKMEELLKDALKAFDAFGITGGAVPVIRKALEEKNGS